MKRSLSYLLLVVGLALAGFGIYSISDTRLEESKAQEEWDIQTATRSAKSVPSRQVKKGALIARLSIKRLKSHWIVIEGAEAKQLRRGPGHVVETAFPGDSGNCVIAGHRDTQFRILRDVKLGEKITVESEGRKYMYRVITRATVSPDDTSSLTPTPIPMLTLITCYPFYYVGPAPKRFVVRAELISSTRSQA